MLASFSECTIELSKDYSLGPVDWQLDSGQVWSIVGANGSGKSALVASLGGEGIVQGGSRELTYSSIAMVSLEEQAALIQREKQRDDSDLTDQISQGTSVKELLEEACFDQALIADLVETFNIHSLLDRGFRKLSTGETRKVLFARAIASAPQLLILDDPFEGLDAATRPRVTDLISKFAGECCLVLVLNRVEDIPDFTTHVMHMENGQTNFLLTVHSPAETRKKLQQIGYMAAEDIHIPASDFEATSVLNQDGSLVRLRNARVAYTDNVVFENLSWTIEPDQHWQVKGPNGSGKTCLLSLITGDHPQCYVNDIELFGYKRGAGESIWEIKQHIGFVSTALHWDYRLSVSVKNVILSGFYDSIGMYQKGSDREIELCEEWLALCGLSASANAPFSSLSYGEQRIVLIARAMVKHPPLLLLDEPCLGLDDLNRGLVLALIQKICDEAISTVVYVTHHDEERIRHIDHVLDLATG